MGKILLLIIALALSSYGQIVDLPTGWIRLTGASGNLARVQLLADFTANPNAGASGLHTTFAFPSPRGSSLYFGHRFDIQDPLQDGSAAIAVFNTGTADSMFIEARGMASGASSPTGIGINMNHIAGVQHNPQYAGIGLQIWDYTTTATNEVPLWLRRPIGGNGPLMWLTNDGEGGAWVRFKAGGAIDQDEGFIFEDKSGAARWWMRKNGVNQFQLIDIQNGRVLLQGTPGALSQLEIPNGAVIGGGIQITAGSATCGMGEFRIIVVDGKLQACENGTLTQIVSQSK